MIVVVDDEDRENDGDLTMAAEMITPEAINFMATHGRGLICLAVTGERVDELELDPMTPRNTSQCGTALTVAGCHPVPQAKLIHYHCSSVSHRRLSGRLETADQQQ
jgi:3,4-dihydroxy-2-butanone 4-phosphate synthase